MSENNPLKNFDQPKLEHQVERVLTPFERFLNAQWMSGLLLFGATVYALLLANSHYKDAYFALKHTQIHLGLGNDINHFSVELLINDGLMVLFFFLLGLEIKRESLAGMLQDTRMLALALIIAAGGMLAPAAIYWLLSPEGLVERGWGIVMATDTAFALTILIMLSQRVPAAIPSLMTALAIIDDLGAVLVIGLFYSDSININALPGAAICLTLLFALNSIGVRKPIFYLVGGLGLWWFIHVSGIHTTTAGILAALAIPARSHYDSENISQRMKRLLTRLEKRAAKQSILEDPAQHEIIEKVQTLAHKSTTPLQLWTSSFERPVALIIIPLFAFFNAGIRLPSDDLISTLDGVTAVIIASLVIGKGLGIFSVFWLAVKARWCDLPEQVGWLHVLGMGFIAGIGFTMSIFIANQAFAGYPALIDSAKVGIIVGSTIAGLLGCGCFLLAKKPVQN